jgi:membrane protease YdiL (CAAX protease family)
MASMRSFWNRLPVLARAVITGLAVAAAGTVPWAALVAANMKHGPTVPWAAPVTAVYLWLFFRYVRGEGWPRSTAAERRAASRANEVPGELWGPALIAGMLGLFSVLLLQGVMSRLVTLPQQRSLDASQFPTFTVAVWVLMSAVVAAVVEETAFRGYLQRPIERRHGPLVAILVAGSLFGLIHFSHPEVTLVLLPYYMAVAAVYGALAYFTDSTLPGMLLHGGGNAWSAVGLFTRGQSEWQLAGTTPPLIWETGPDGAFVATVAALIVVGAVTLWAFSELARAARVLRA